MTVYVLNQVNYYPDVDGVGEIIGVYSSEEKAREAAEEARPGIEYYLGAKYDDRELYKLVIEEFEVEGLA